MVETVTAHYGWTKPEVTKSASTWGGFLNNDLDAIDAQVWSITNTNATFVGSVTVNGGLTAQGLVTNGFTNTNGYTVSQASGSGDADFVMNNAAGALMGYLTWNHATNAVSLVNQTGVGIITISTDGSVSTSGAFHTGTLTAADITCSSFSCSGNGSFSGQLNTVGAIHSGGSLSGTGLISRPGVSGTSDFGHQYNFNWNTSNSHNELWLDGNNWGQIQTNSDYRMKKDVEPLGSMWGAVKALNPISYTHRDWTPPASDLRVVGDDIERWGFLAHELQETLVQSASHGVKDDPVCVQTPNPFTVIAALTRALQEAMTRIEALEAAR